MVSKSNLSGVGRGHKPKGLTPLTTNITTVLAGPFEDLPLLPTKGQPQELSWANKASQALGLRPATEL